MVCSTCVNGSYLYAGACLSQCVGGYYRYDGNWSCLACVPPCLECMSAYQCLSCTTGYVLTASKWCTLSCPDGSYPDTSFTCQQCPPPCTQCYSPSSCTKCLLPSILYNQSCISIPQCQSLNRYIHYLLNYSSASLSYESGTC